MKAFDIKLAKAGYPVCTRDGKKVRIICYDRKTPGGYPIVALIMNEDGYEEEWGFTEEGNFFTDASNHPSDLFMVPTKREGWINIFKVPSAIIGVQTQYTIWDTKEIAEEQGSNIENYLTTVKIEWEE